MPPGSLNNISLRERNPKTLQAYPCGVAIVEACLDGVVSALGLAIHTSVRSKEAAGRSVDSRPAISGACGVDLLPTKHVDYVFDPYAPDQVLLLTPQSVRMAVV